MINSGNFLGSHIFQWISNSGHQSSGRGWGVRSGIDHCWLWTNITTPQSIRSAVEISNFDISQLSMFDIMMRWRHKEVVTFVTFLACGITTHHWIPMYLNSVFLILASSFFMLVGRSIKQGEGATPVSGPISLILCIYMKTNVKIEEI